MPFEFGSSNRVSALELVYGSFEDVEAGWYDVKYGQLDWRKVVPEASVDTAVNPGATEKSYRVRDWRGKGEFRASHDTSIPTVGRTIGKNRIPIEVAGISGIFDREDARQVQFGYSENLLSELTQTMRMAGERHVEGVVFYGNTNVGFDGWLAYPNVTITAAPNGASGDSEWSTKTEDEILSDINGQLTSVWENSNHVHLPDTVFLPGEQYSLITNRRIPDAAGISVLKYVQENNLYTNMTGRPLNFVPIRYLNQAGGSNADRMVVAELREPTNFKLPFPIQFDLLEPQEYGFDVNLFGEYKFGSFHVPYPRNMGYLDGI